ADDGVDLGFQLHRIGDAHVVHVEDDVAVVGDHALAVHRVAAQLHQLPRHVAAGHGDDLHRQREGPEPRHQLAGVVDADEGFGHRRDDLLAGKGSAAAHGQVESSAALVGAVDIELLAIHRVLVVHRNAVAAQPGGGGFGAGHGAVEGHPVPGQGVDEEVGGGAGADTDHALAVELGKDVVDGGLGHRLLELILGHDASAGLEKRDYSPATRPVAARPWTVRIHATRVAAAGPGE